MIKKKHQASVLYDGKPLAAYDQWLEMAGGFAAPHPQLIGKAGLYRAVSHGEIIFIGKGAGMRTGLFERLYDLRRPGDSGRRYTAGRYINARLTELTLEVMIIGTSPASRKLTSKLLWPMIQLHRPRLNVDPAFIANIVQEQYRDR